jgi:recombination protein RecR
MESPYPPSIQNLIDQFSRLPGIGKRSAERMAYHVLSSSKEDAMALALAVRDIKKNIRACRRCFNVAEAELCEVCADSRRDHSLVCVVELPRDIISVEKTGAFRGVYHALQGKLNPAEGIGPENLRVRELHERVKNPDDGVNIREIILALNPTTEGDATAAFLAGEFSAYENLRVTRLARGLSSGTDLESTAPSSLQFALEGRREVDKA